MAAPSPARRARDRPGRRSRCRVLAASAGGVASCIALFTVAVHRPTRTVLWIAALYLAAVPDLHVPSAHATTRFWVSARRRRAHHRRPHRVGHVRPRPPPARVSLRDRAAARRGRAASCGSTQAPPMPSATRIAREMHDVLAHRISLLSLHAGRAGVPARRPAGGGRARRRASSGPAPTRRCEDLREVIGVLREDGEPARRPSARSRRSPTCAAPAGGVARGRACACARDVAARATGRCRRASAATRTGSSRRG